jgi:hypothetical protein
VTSTDLKAPNLGTKGAVLAALTAHWVLLEAPVALAAFVHLVLAEDAHL